MQKYQTNIVHLEKGKWLENGEIFCCEDPRNLEFNCLESFADKINNLDMNFWNFDGILTDEIAKKFSKFKNLKHMKQHSAKIPSIELNFFYSFEILSCLELVIPAASNLSENLFVNLNKLKDLKLVLNNNLKLNTNHFNGLKNLDSLNIFGAIIDEDLDSLVNLTKLQLSNVQLDNFSLQNLDNLNSIDFDFMQEKRSIKFKEKFFINLKNLKKLEIFKFEKPIDALNKVERNFIKEVFRTLPTNVKEIITNISLYEYIKSSSISMPFYGQLKDFEICFDINEDKIQISHLFNENLFQNLESLVLNRKLWDISRLNYSNNHILTIEELKNMKNLMKLKLKGFLLVNIDEELNNLVEASFCIRIPTNISNFFKLEKLHIEGLTEKIVLNENFLENLINIKELILINVFNSIDSDVQFLFKKMTKLKKIILYLNVMKSVKSTYFEYLVDLEEIELEANAIEVIETGSFKNLSKLMKLYIFGNSIKELKRYMFSNEAKPEIFFNAKLKY